MGIFSKLFGTDEVTDVSPVDAQALLRKGALLVDVREKREWDAGHAPKAKHVPLGTLASAMDRLPDHRTLVIVCRSGNRSARATKQLRAAGFDALNLTGGMVAWKAAGLPLVSSRGKAGSVI